MATDNNDGDELRTTPLHGLHSELGARLVPFAGWEMPIQYEGVIAEHTWCRTNCGLFDVSHMAVIELRGDDPAASLERVTPAGITTLEAWRQRYGLLLDESGGVIDDFMVTNWATHLTMVANASRRDIDLAFLRRHLPDVEITERPDVALIAIQGPDAAAVVADVLDDEHGDGVIDDMVFLDNRPLRLAGVEVLAARSGYTGEDGFEIAVAAADADHLARALLAHDAVKPVGLAARDTLRLEAGLCLYGNDLTTDISPVEADLVWSMPKRRREAGDFLGAERVQAELADGPTRIRVGVKPAGKRPVRDGTTLYAGGSSESGTEIGFVSSGGFGPTVDGPVAMGYVAPALAQIGTELIADVRGNDVACTVAELPFAPHRYHRG
ncbi:MAG: glycine cleavage system aminomethyltransferase GcvT [Acidimicrobiia bacterium]|nr:glycine cleavage system aminomethyltransferase GcvT [Acidimicrobiia bacterium]